MKSSMWSTQSPSREATRGTAVFALTSALMPASVWLAVAHPATMRQWGASPVFGMLLEIGTAVALLGSLPFFAALKGYLERHADEGRLTAVVAGLAGGLLGATSGVIACAAWAAAVVNG